MVDRPLGSRHPEHRSLIYKVNYGYVADVVAADNEWQDAYVLGISEPLEVFDGEVAAIIHRLNDVEDKWVVTEPDVRLSEADVRAQTDFMERFFQSIVLLR
ncbi:MAG: inorganic pyrophosphatase [Clostridia bacterium]|nr:inorganic pyrophosphatase [Clostridia bacterium]